MLMPLKQGRRQELGDFLKSRRNRLQPADYGLPIGTRRKAKGLRREELAQLAGIGLSWYTWLEQGREINASQDVLESLARVMRLSAEEKNHLFLLALQQPPTANKPETIRADVQTVVQHFLDHWADCPAYVTDHKWDVLAWNRAACAVFGDFSAMNEKERNAVWRCFRSASYRELLVDWEGHAKRLLASFRSTSTCHVGEDWYQELVQELIEHSKEFQQWWLCHDIMGTPIGTKALLHPKAGLMMMEHITFQVYDAPDLKVTLYRPLPDNNTVVTLAKLLEEYQDTNSLTANSS